MAQSTSSYSMSWFIDSESVFAPTPWNMACSLQYGVGVIYLGWQFISPKCHGSSLELRPTCHCPSSWSFSYPNADDDLWRYFWYARGPWYHDSQSLWMLVEDWCTQRTSCRWSTHRFHQVQQRLGNGVVNSRMRENAYFTKWATPNKEHASASILLGHGYHLPLC